MAVSSSDGVRRATFDNTALFSHYTNGQGLVALGLLTFPATSAIKAAPTPLPSFAIPIVTFFSPSGPISGTSLSASAESTFSWTNRWTSGGMGPELIAASPGRQRHAGRRVLALPLEPWAGGPRDRLLRIPLDRVTGRRLVAVPIS